MDGHGRLARAPSRKDDAMKDEIELEDWVASDRDRPIPEARRYRVRLWDGDGFDEKRVLTDPMPTGHQSLDRSEEHTSELQSLMRTSHAALCLKQHIQTPLPNSHHIHKQTRKH